MSFMEAHALRLFAADLVERHEVPQVLDVEHSIQVHKPTLTGSASPASYYIRPPDGMSADELIDLFEKTPGFEKMNLTLISILGLDTYHQPLASADDFAKKYFSDNRARIIRVVGKSDPAIEAMAAFIQGLKRPFDAAEFPHHSEFLVSGYRAHAPGKPPEVKLLFKPADPTLLMKIERAVKLHLAEFNLGREIGASRHYTREQPPELILASTWDAVAGNAYLEALANSLPRATEQDVEQARLASERTAPAPAPDATAARPHFGMAQPVQRTLPPDELRRRVISCLAGILKDSMFGGGLEIKIVQGGTGIDVEFPRSARSLWLATTFDERKHISAVKAACVAVRADPLLREGWDLHYRFDPKTGKLHLRAADPGAPPATGAKLIP